MKIGDLVKLKNTNKVGVVVSEYRVRSSSGGCWMVEVSWCDKRIPSKPLPSAYVTLISTAQEIINE